MARNAVLLISSVAILLTLFIVYSRIVQDPAGGAGSEEHPIDALPQPREGDAGESIEVANMHVPPGGEIVFRVYDPNTGRPTDQMRCAEWSAVPGSKSEIFVREPELTMLLPSGMVAVISATEAQLSVDRVQRRNMKPKLGWMRGNVRFVIDRSTLLDRTPITERPEDAITITMETLDFDLDLGEMRTDGAITVMSRDFEVRGAGLALTWNQADNRVESLTLARGEELVLWGGSGLFGSVMESAATTKPDVVASAEAADAPEDTSQQELSTMRRVKRKPRVTSYECTLGSDVIAEQWSGEQRIGSLNARALKLTFDLGADASGGIASRRSENASTAPADSENRERLVVRWSGPLTLGPAADARPGLRRRRIEASGPDVRLTRGEGTVHCGRLEFFDDTSQVWLYPTTDGLVHLAMGDDLTATAGSIYIDRSRGQIKLIHNVTMESRRDRNDERPMRMRCAQWAELFVQSAGSERPKERADVDAPPASAAGAVDFGDLKRAEFVGDVYIDMRGQILRAGRLQTEFREGPPGEPIGQRLQRAIAREGADLRRTNERMRAQLLDITFGSGRDREPYPQHVTAVGAVRVTQGKTEIRGGRVEAELAESGNAAPEQTERSTFVLHYVRIDGDAWLRDPGNQMEARGRSVAARFDERGELTIAEVLGSADRWGRIRSGGFSVRGERIDIDRPGQSLQVPGRSSLRFVSQTGLSGQRRAKPGAVTVSSETALLIDGRANRVYFTGAVEARSGNETLRADEMALHLEDAAPSPVASNTTAPQQQVLNLLRGWWTALTGTADGGDARSLLRTGESDREMLARKEPIRLVATNAVVESELPSRGEPLPLVHSSITAPALDVDIPRRLIRTTGQTTLLVTDRRLRGLSEDSAGAALPSALVTRGPSQSAMQCEGGMTYRVGEDGSIRADSVVFERAVVFVHRAGRDMVALEEMLPQLRGDKELLARMQSRNTYLECDRLEVGFQSRGESGQSTGALAGGMQLHSLVTAGNTYLVDRQGPGVRTVHADRLEFDRERGVLRVYGTPTADARVYYENAELRRFDAPAVGPRFVIDLQRNTVEADKMSGEIRR